ncbi:MAG: hypothetical protein NVSMB2_17330 [Chloroflexota bacterium]
MRFRAPTGLASVLALSTLAGSLLASAAPAAAAVNPAGPDLSLTMTQSATQINSGGALTYSLTVRNSAVYQRTCEIGPLGKPLCYMEMVAGAPVSGVVVQDTLPAGATLQSYTANGGFACTGANTLVTCSGGSLAEVETVTISLTVHEPTIAPGVNQTITNSATVNPSQSIDERTYANNSASISTTLIAPPVLPDLVVTDFSGGGWVPRGGQAMYSVTIANIGQASATGVTVLIDGGTSDFNVASSSGSPGFAPCFNSVERFSMRAWCPGFGNGPSLAPGQSATMTLIVTMPTTYTGSWSMRATVDPFNNVAESNKANNTSTQPVTTTVY